MSNDERFQPNWNFRPRLGFANKIAEVKENPITLFAMATALSQVFPLVSAPILSRLYSPVAFGSYAIYFALSSILGTLVILSMQNAIILEENDEDALVVLCATLVPPVVISGILFAILLIVRPLLTMKFLNGLDKLLLLVPATVLLSSFYLAGYTWLLRLGRYKTLAINRVTLAASTMLLQIGIGLLRLETIGFIVANMAGYFLAGLFVYRQIVREAHGRFHCPSFSTIVSIFKKHKATAVFTTPASLLNTASSYLPDFFVARLFGPAVLGQYSLGMRTVSMPLSFVSTTVQDIFRREAAREHSSTGQCRKTFFKYLALMTVISFTVLAPLIWALPHIFQMIFGSTWTHAGSYVQCVGVLLVIRFISSPLSYVWIVAGKQHLDAIWQIGLVVLAAGSFILPEIIFGVLAPEVQFRIYGAVVGAWYAIALIFSYYWTKTK